MAVLARLFRFVLKAYVYFWVIDTTFSNTFSEPLPLLHVVTLKAVVKPGLPGQRLTV